VAAWRDSAAASGTACARRIFLATVDSRLLALDAATGRLCAGFGAGGTVDLQRDVLHQPEYLGEYEVTSPPAIAGDLVIVGSAIADNHRTNAPSGVVRAFDARSGRERWNFDPIPRTADAPGRETWQGRSADSTGAANAWSVISVDAAHDLVFIPVGSASPDFYGGERLGQNRWADAVVALRASTGKFVWGFQVVHHDIWDDDVPAQPVLFTLHRNGKDIPALAQVTKMGHVFVFDRLTGTPLFPVAERPVPKSDVAGEQAWPTQPFPPPAFRLVPESLPPSDAFGTSPVLAAGCRDVIAHSRSEGIFTPPSLQGTVVYPGNVGGSNWSAAVVDERRGVLITPVNRLPFLITLIPRDQLHSAYMAQPESEYGRQTGTPFAMRRDPFLAPNHVPCAPPPWGSLIALDLNAGTVKWSVPLGTVPWLTDSAAKNWGSLNIGGAMATAGGLVFIAGTWDHHLRAFDEASGKELWSAPLPVGAHAMPMTYEAGGRQYVVVVAGGHDRLDPGMGDYVLAFTLSGPGAPRPDSATYSAAGDYAGDIRSGDLHVTTMSLRAAGDSLVGSYEFTNPKGSGSVTAHQVGNTVTFTAPFRAPEKSCDGTMTGRGEMADGGRLFVGRILITGACSGTPPDSATFGLWRRVTR
jgi:quinoprotein glucose dehydrogenase